MNMRREPKAKLPTVTIHCDGSCLNNNGSGTGGWAALLRYNGHEKLIKGSAEQTTNNRMELRAAIEGLSTLKFPCSVTLFSDSQYLVKTMTENWKRKANQDLWAELDELNKMHSVTYNWVQGHIGQTENELVNSAAQEEARKLQKTLEEQDEIP